MDRFKLVNDLHGHAAGNRVLEGTAHALREAGGKSSYAARMGGDEFVLLLPDTEAEEVQVRIRQLHELVAEHGRQVFTAWLLRLSVGVASFPEDGANAEELLAGADARMYEMKRKHHSETETAGNLTRMASAVESLAERSEAEALRKLA